MTQKHTLILVAGLFLFLVLTTSCAFNKRTETLAGKSIKAVVRTKSKILYGINIDSLKVLKGKVKRNQFLSNILLKYGVNYKVIEYIARRTRDMFDVRDMRMGHHYAVIFANDSTQKPLYFVYEQSPTHYVRYHLYDSVYVELGKKPVEKKLVTSAGTIKTSFWDAIQDNNGDGALAIRLSEIYAWTIDFFELRPNDKYKVIYRKLYVDGKYAGLGRILAADFIHKGKNNFAFYFEQNGKGDYFDEQGKSLERTFLKAPLKYTRISSRFSARRWEPILKIYRPHHGVDYAAPMGTPVYSLGNGIIYREGYQKRGAGNYIKIRHNAIYSTQYAHLSHFARGMKIGTFVKQGQLIGYVGETGLATGPHLDFRFFKNGKAINPLKVKSPPAKPILKSYKPAFDSLVKVYMPVLDSL